MIDWTKHIQKIEVVRFHCRKCGFGFPHYELAQRHVVDEHNVEVAVGKCIICGEAFIVEIEGQKKCPNKDCILTDLSHVGNAPND